MFTGVLSGTLLIQNQEKEDQRLEQLELRALHAISSLRLCRRSLTGNKMTSKYNGKLSGDSIKGKAETDRNGETQSRDWEAKRDGK